MFRSLICLILIAAMPASLSAADAGAMLFSKGVVLRNGTQIPDSSAVFPGDLIETKADSMATLNSMGSSVIILPGSLVEFQGKSISVEHGSVTVATSQELSARAGCVMVVPVSTSLTQYEVTDVTGKVEVLAEKGDVQLEVVSDSGSQKLPVLANSTLREGEQATRNESDGCKGNGKTAPSPAGGGSLFSSPYVRYGALAAAGLVGLWLALGSSSNPPSPSQP